METVFDSLPREVVAALAAYEQAVENALRHAPNHWHEYRDPFELSPAISNARRLGRAAREVLDV